MGCFQRHSLKHQNVVFHWQSPGKLSRPGQKTQFRLIKIQSIWGVPDPGIDFCLLRMGYNPARWSTVPQGRRPSILQRKCLWLMLSIVCHVVSILKGNGRHHSQKRVKDSHLSIDWSSQFWYSILILSGHPSLGYDPGAEQRQPILLLGVPTQ